jgi:hypothetical protein
MSRNLQKEPETIAGPNAKANTILTKKLEKPQKHPHLTLQLAKRLT